jgi:hypothetical protein
LAKSKNNIATQNSKSKNFGTRHAGQRARAGA